MHFLLTFCLLFLLVGCAEHENHDQAQHQDHNDHLGCQEGEVVDGKCQVAAKKNVDLFSQLEALSVQTEMVDYFEGVNGFLAKPEGDGKYPAVVMIHEWWGLNDNIKDMARLMASEGYVVLAVDIYEGEVATESGAAMKLASGARSNPERSIENMKAAVDYLKTLSNVEPQSIAAMGWCFGGQQSLSLSLSTDDLAATVIYYGNLETDKEKLANIKGPVLGIFGETDQGIPVESVNAFEAALNELLVKNQIHIYPEVGHAFANPSGTRYAPEETQDAWKKTIDFLDENLKKKSQEN